MSEPRTAADLVSEEAVEAYIRALPWGDHADDDHVTLVAGNLRTFAALVRDARPATPAEDYAREAAAVIRPLAKRTEGLRADLRAHLSRTAEALAEVNLAPPLESEEDVEVWAGSLHDVACSLQTTASGLLVLAALAETKLACWAVVATHPAFARLSSAAPSAARPDAPETR